MASYLGLGSNLGDRRANLRAAIGLLAEHGVSVDRVSPVVESPALLPAGAPSDWNRPFLNLAVECRTAAAPDELLAGLKRIERSMGRRDDGRWAPRSIDIDILLFGDRIVETERLRIPHAALAERSFVLTPLSALAPGLEVPSTGGRTVFELSAELGPPIPLWMGIVNLTPDSFSDGGQNATWEAVEARIDLMIDHGVSYLDLGAESTRPGAAPLTAETEWARLEPMLTRTIDKLGTDPLRPRISVDTYHPAVARRALAVGVDLINDVGGLAEAEMRALAAASDAEFVAMHSLGLPADPSTTLAADRSAADQIDEWLGRRLETWRADGIELDRVIFDPGIGFGKAPLQSLEVLRRAEAFRNVGLRLLVGHSRKSYMSGFAGAAMRERDLATVGGSLALCVRGVDILRVHNVPDHAAAYRGWAHLQPAGGVTKKGSDPFFVDEKGV